MEKMWSGRFIENASSLLDEFNASLNFDKKLYQYDIMGSLAHAKMLHAQGILTDKEYHSIVEGMQTIRNEIESGNFEFNVSDEDIHMAIEKRLTQIIGDAGKKLHTARSRNDQVALDFRLYVQAHNEIIRKLILNLIEAFVLIGKEHTQTMLPGMTHLQHAQPINFGYHLMAYASMLKRDYERFESSFKRNNLSPIGCAALAGTPHPINRKMTAKELGFDAPTLNCLDTVSDRDFALEMLFNIATMMMHISRFSEELIIWSSSEFGFVTLSDAYSTGSSIMPQKKNPDVPELLRGKTGRTYGNLISLLTVMKGLPLAYNKDMQEDKEGTFDSVETAEISLTILTEVIKTMTVNKERMEQACKIGHLSATDLADYLVEKCNIPFREAHFITGRAVALAERNGCDLSELNFEDLHAIDKRIEQDVIEYLSIRHSMNSRDSEGGTSTRKTKEQIEKLENWLKSVKD
jgi:argininosuccinate lyase